ncbi:MAG: hypothetical protein M3464_04020 [Chloroflexota bacterium]|nr:hypothetical protein [Chloroflexota bacterium]
MASSTLKVVVGSTIYFVDDPKAGEGLKATVSAVVDEGPDGSISRIRHRDRLNLDRARDRTAFAQAAGTDAGDLNQVRDRVLDFLAPPPQAATDEPAEDEAESRQAAEELLTAPDLLGLVEQVIRDLGYAGERWLPLLVFLVFVSRLLERPTNLVITGPSAAGKSFVVMLVARLFPAAASYSLNGMSERLLAYTEADLRHRTLVIGEASALERDGIGASLLRSVAWEGSVAYETVEKTSEGLKARRIEKPGPTGFVTTTTGRVEPELGTRVLVAHVPDDPGTTRTILLATAARVNGHAPTEPDLRPWHAAQRMLEKDGTREVTVPFAERLAQAYRADQVRARRDFVQLLGLVQAHALLFRAQRDRDSHGRIVADEQDYRAVFTLAAPIFGAIAAEGATPIVHETVAAVLRLVPNAKSDPVAVNQVALELGVHKSVASRRISLALRGGWLTNEEERKGRPLRLRPGDPLPADEPALPEPNELFGDSVSNRATAQPQDEEPDTGAEPGAGSGCMDGCAAAPGSGEAERPVSTVTDRLQSPVQPHFWPGDDENDLYTGDGCTVAGGATAPASGTSGAVLERRCIDCGAVLPAGWLGFYCVRHGGAQANEHASNESARSHRAAELGEEVWF